MTVQDKLARLHRGPTRYELVAECGDRRVLIAYTAGSSRHVMLTSMQKHGPALIKLAGVAENTLLMFVRQKSGPAAYVAELGAWKVRFTGRTQREAVQSELPWIGDVAA